MKKALWTVLLLAAVGCGDKPSKMVGVVVTVERRPAIFDTDGRMFLDERDYIHFRRDCDGKVWSCGAAIGRYKPGDRYP